MKRFIAFLITLLYTSTNSVFAFSELYYLKNIKTEDIRPIVADKYLDYNFNLIKQNPYYGVTQEGDDYAVIILQQSGENMFYYYQSENNTKLNRAILKEIKKQDVICEQSFNNNIISIYDNLAQDVITTTGAVKKYTFEDTTSAFTPPTTQSQQQSQGSLRGYVAQIATGTKIPVYLQNAINTSTASKGDKVVAVLTGNLTYNGAVIAPQGSLMVGSLSKARNATYGSRNGRVVINFNQIITPDNKTYDISTEEIDFTVTNEGKIGESAKNAVVSAAVGALTGMLFAALCDRNVGRGALVGAGVGAGSSVIYSTAERGVDAEIPSFTELEVTLSRPFSVSVSY